MPATPTSLSATLELLHQMARLASFSRIPFGRCAVRNCSPLVLRKPDDLRGHVLVHCYWSPSDFEAPTWERWLAVARKRWPDAPELKGMDHLSFREELHAIEAVIAGQGIGLFSNVLVAPELNTQTLVKAFDVSLPGYQYYLVHQPDHHREKIIKSVSMWIQSTV